MAEKAPIHEAAIRGDVDSLRRELAAGNSPNIRTPSTQNSRGRKTPLHLCFSAWRGINPECVRVLIAAGADINARDSWGQMPLHYAACHGVPLAARPLTPRFDVSDATQALELLLGAGANVSARINVLGMTPLHCAAEGGCAYAIEPLIRAGALVNERDAYNKTPLDHAIERRRQGYPYGLSVNEQSRLSPLLLRAGADLPAQTDDPYLQAVIDAGGFKKYAQSHLATIAALFARTERLPPEMVRHVVSFWLHAGYYVY